MARKYSVWVEGTDEKLSRQQMSLDRAKSFARIGSQKGAPREVVRGKDGVVVRVYDGGIRVFPVSEKGLEGLSEKETPTEFKRG